MRQLTIEPEFRDKIPPLSADEFSKLEENIVADGEVREPLVIWGNTIIDGHHRWKIIQKHPGIPYKVKQMEFPDKWAAIVWMCRNQLGRRNITDEQKTVLIGEAYKAQKMSVGAPAGNRNADKQCAQNEHIVSDAKRTSEVIAKKFGVGRETVKRAEHYVDGLNVAEEIFPGIKEAVLSGTIKAPKKIIAEIRNVPDEKKICVVDAISNGKIGKAKEIMDLKKKSNNPEGYPKERRDLNQTINNVVNQMYDTSRVVEHTVDDLLEDLNALISDFSGKVNRTLANHSTLLADDKNKEKVIAALVEAETAIKKIKEIIL